MRVLILRGGKSWKDTIRIPCGTQNAIAIHELAATYVDVRDRGDKNEHGNNLNRQKWHDRRNGQDLSGQRHLRSASIFEIKHDRHLPIDRHHSDGAHVSRVEVTRQHNGGDVVKVVVFVRVPFVHLWGVRVREGGGESQCVWDEEKVFVLERERKMEGEREREREREGEK